jgi:hypothetical protein
MLSLKELSDLVVKKSDFDPAIYVTVYSREESKKYYSSEEIAKRLNDSKVIILDKRGKKILHRNFLTFAEVQG